MNKCLITTFFILGAMSAPQFASAETCAELGYTVGKTCTGGANVLTNSACTSTSAGCKFVNCNSRCSCRPSGICNSGGGGITPSFGCSDCVSSINWGVVSRHNGVQSGTPVMKSTASRCDSCKATVYRCGSGYYADTSFHGIVAGMPEDCVSDSPSYCEPCPSAPDYKPSRPIVGAPAHVDSPAGFAKITDCYVKANAGVVTETGTYVYTSNCKYTE